MTGEKNQDQNKRIEELEQELSKLKLELENSKFQEKQERDKRLFYQLIAEFAFAWELWFEPNGDIKYCSPSCSDLTGFTANQIIASSGIADLLVYDTDKEKYDNFLTGALNQTLVNQTLEFRVLTRTKQLRWFMMNVRGVYDKFGKYLGIRASVLDISRLKQAMGHISELERSKEFDSRNKQRLQTELEMKDRELVSFLLQLSQKNELLTKAVHLLQSEESLQAKKASSLIKKLKDLLQANAVQPVDWSMVENQVEKIHPGFLDRLQKRHPKVSVNDKKLCSYIRLGLSSKEIAGLLNITSKSVEISRVRLRKKLGINAKIRLVNYLEQL
ncbi:PAS domain S-box protein [Draconibacterium sp. IB214405]|uniref:PAS domain-containing protein n=1 Tax=Draconibacterium sp. IB214405 TaxID=3097352 RepID=UPI002A16D131|nr:PAS domain-containing protein [Draconibacterium sp. IB214405]MDX8341213.1 PAS domain S-box protein [Draconibacterium sp. IB214405]